MLFASPGYASSPRVSAELLSSTAGFTFTDVLYKGTAPILTGLVGGQVHALMGAMSVMPYVRNGKLQALTVASERRLSQVPEVPTMVEAGGPNFTSASWFGFFVQTKQRLRSHKKFMAICEASRACRKFAIKSMDGPGFPGAKQGRFRRLPQGRNREMGRDYPRTQYPAGAVGARR